MNSSGLTDMGCSHGYDDTRGNIDSLELVFKFTKVKKKQQWNNISKTARKEVENLILNEFLLTKLSYFTNVAKV